VAEDLRLHTIAHLRFYARNRLLLAFALLVGAIALLTLVPPLVYGTDTTRFNALKQLTTTLYWFASFMTAGLGLLAMWSHISTRSVKLVLTKPSSPGRWVAAILLSAFLVSVTLHAAVTAITFSLSVVWGVGYPIGFVFVALHSLCGTMVVLSFLTVLATFVHTVIAGMLILREFIEAGFVGHRGGWLSALQAILAGVYAMMPMTNPFEQHLQGVYGSLRVSGADWGYLAASAAYSAGATLFFWVVSVAVLRRRTLI
jgi:hypothetical protein